MWGDLLGIKRTGLNERNDPTSPRYDPQAFNEKRRIDRRKIYVNRPPDDHDQRKFPPNRIKTSKYTIWTFLPKNIVEQFRGIANFYFLTLVILQAFDLFKTVDIFITAAPIIVIVAITSLKDAFEDWKRHQSDSLVNNSITYTLADYENPNFPANNRKGGRFDTIITLAKDLLTKLWDLKLPKGKLESTQNATDITPFPTDIFSNDYCSLPSSGDRWTLTKWKDIKVGDFIFLRNKERIPADIIVVSTSEPDSLCYVETKNLDGETNLKIKKGLPELSNINTPDQCRLIKGFIDSEPPSTSLYQYYGTLTVDELRASVRESKVGPNESVIHQKVIPLTPNHLLLRGCTLRNTQWLIGIVAFTGTDTKTILNSGATPSKRSRVDKQINPHILLNFSILACMCLVSGIIGAMYNKSFRYNENFLSGVITVFNCLIIFQNLIPIALYISLEATKSFQSFLINRDIEMYDPVTDKSVEPKSWNLCDDLDKTGTLTSNVMEFRKASINGQLYGKIFQGTAQNEAKDEAQAKMKSVLSKLFDTSGASPSYSFVDIKIAEDLFAGNVQAFKIREFFTLLAVCHTVLLENTGNPENPRVYNAQSPDEAALVTTAKDIGFEFISRSHKSIEVVVIGEKRTYSILNIMEFNSDRKRMSLIVQRPEGEIILLCKGADSVIYERLSDDNDEELLSKTMDHLGKFANEGLRTLCLAYRIISESEYRSWADKYKQAQALITERDAECDKLADLIERDLILMGATAIEDKLQDDVPQSISLLHKAGIKIWVLTGDKLETAINIGFSCNLLKKSMVLIVIKAESSIDAQNQIQEALSRFWNESGIPRNEQTMSLIIDGDSLKYGLDDYCKPYLLELGCRCKTVICCRVTPLQKAMVVQMGAMCLAIGDGANDVSMIQEADIGIGISGKEGLQAAMAGDYSIAQFRFLTRLLLVHGKWAYIRSSSMVLNYFYKNLVWILIQFWHQFYSGFNAAIIFEITYSMFFNTVFTVLPTLFIGVFDQDINATISLLVPQIYAKGIKQELYTSIRFWEITAVAIYQSIACYFVGFAFVNDVSDGANGSYDVQYLGTTIAFGAILVINVYSISHWYNWTYLTHVALWSSFVSWTAYVLLFSTAKDSPAYGLLEILFKAPNFYLAVILMSFVSMLPILVFKFTQQLLYPSDTDIVREIQALHKHYDWVSGPIASFQTIQGPKTEQSGVSSFLNGSASKLSASEDKKAASSSNMVKIKMDKKASSDGFGDNQHSNKRRFPKLLGEAEINRSRPPSSGLGNAIKIAGDFMKKISGNDKHKVGRHSSLVYMGKDGGLRPNTGFAFSHDTGMEDVITPKGRLMPVLEEPARKPAKLRNISDKLSYVLAGKKKETSE